MIFQNTSIHFRSINNWIGYIIGLILLVHLIGYLIAYETTNCKTASVFFAKFNLNTWFSSTLPHLEDQNCMKQHYKQNPS